MTTLLDRYGKPCAYLYNNKILSAGSMEVIGVTLGNCVFGKSGEAKGKIFDRVFYSLSGEIVATEIELQSMPEFDLVEVLFQGWNILEKIKDHLCPWITPNNKWIAVDIKDFLVLPGTFTVIRLKNNNALQQL